MSKDCLKQRKEPLRYVTKYKGQVIGRDDSIPSESRETSFSFTEGDKSVTIMSHTQAVMEGLLSCPKFKVISIELALIEGTKKNRNRNREEKVVGVKGSLPIGMLSIKSPRADNAIFRIISPRVQTLDRSKMTAPSRPRRDNSPLKSTQKGKGGKVTTSKKRRRAKQGAKAYQNWVYG